MSGRTTPPYRADHVGSLLHPPQLLQAREGETHGREPELQDVLDWAARRTSG